MKKLMKRDRIPPPYSSALAFGIVALGGLILEICFRSVGFLGLGIILGGGLALMLKSAAEASDREIWQHLRWLIGRSGPKR